MKENQKTKNPQSTLITIIALLLLTSVCSGIISGWWFTQRLLKEIVVIDINEIVSKKKKEFTEKFSNRNIDSTTNKEMAGDIERFTDRLRHVLSLESQNKVILRKDAVISDVEDITDRVEREIWKD